MKEAGQMDLNVCDNNYIKKTKTFKRMNSVAFRKETEELLLTHQPFSPEDTKNGPYCKLTPTRDHSIQIKKSFLPHTAKMI